MVTIDCETATRHYLENLGSAFSCAEHSGWLGITTPYPYPDNDLIEVFVREHGSDQIRVSDLGETLRHLASLGMDLASSRSQREMVGTIAEGRAVSLHRGQLYKDGPVDSVGELMFDVIVAARGVADLILRRKTYEHAAFKEEVGDLLQKAHLEYQTGVSLSGASGMQYKIDFWIPKTNRYIETLSPARKGGMQARVNGVFRKWADLDNELKQPQKQSLLNDVDFSWRAEDVNILDRVSDIRLWSKPDEWLESVTTTA